MTSGRDVREGKCLLSASVIEVMFRRGAQEAARHLGRCMMVSGAGHG